MLHLPQQVIGFMDQFKKKGYEIYIVGGAIRNLLIGKYSDNWDFTTSAKPEEIQKLFPESFYNNIYGTVSIPIKNTDNNQLIFEITPFRKEGIYRDNRHPEIIEWAQTVEEDLGRRDFTINAIAYDGKKIIDPFNGQLHIKEKKIVAVGDPDKRFQEDALRIIRAVRFASELGFLIEEQTRNSLSRNSHLIQNISWERIRDEFFKILESKHPSDGILFLRSAKILEIILPELEACFSIPQKSPKRHHIYDVGTHCVMSLKYCPSKDPITRFATLLHDIGKVKAFKKNPQNELITFHNHEVIGTILVEQIAKRFRLSHEQTKKIVTLVKYHQFTVSEIITDKAVRRFIREVGKEYLHDMFDLRTGDRIGSGAKPTSWRYELFKKRVIQVQKEPFTVKDLKINGYDVMKTLNIKPGRQVGDILNYLFEEVVEKKLPNTKEALMEKLKTVYLI